MRHLGSPFHYSRRLPHDVARHAILELHGVYSIGVAEIQRMSLVASLCGDDQLEQRFRSNDSENHGSPPEQRQEVSNVRADG
jgi:hypothetical protein